MGRAEPLMTFEHPVTVEVRVPDVHVHAAVAHLDVDRIARLPHAEIELGHVDSGCCRRDVVAVVRDGKVTEVRARPCEGAEAAPADPELRKVLDRVRKEARRGPGDLLPLPVADALLEVAQLVVTSITCYRICLFGYCIDCCHTPSGDWICGTLTIDTTRLPHPQVHD